MLEEESPPPPSPSQPSVPFEEEKVEEDFEQENDLPGSDSSRKNIDFGLPSLNSLPRRFSEQEDLSFENPQFFVELKEEPLELRNELKMTPFGNRSANSPSSYFGTPVCRFNFFKSPMPSRTQPVTNLLSAMAQTWQEEDPNAD